MRHPRPQNDSTMNTLTYFIETWGCQMNVHDSERLADALQRSGYSPANNPESAAVIVLNTCSVRDKAAQKVFTRLGRLTRLKQAKHSGAIPSPSAAGTGPLLCVAGCVAQQEGLDILSRCPGVDLVLGTRRTAEIGDILERVWAGEGPLVSTELDSDTHQHQLEPIHRLSPWKAYVTIIEGCDNFCAYCIVPLVRGRENSRDADHILEEIQSLVRSGVREIELLGQNVNSYNHGRHDFSSLLRRSAAIQGLDRLRFTVSHPRDFTPGLARLMADHSNVVCKHLHLPLQSGSDAVLLAMGRGYTRESYLQKIAHLKSLIPDISISTDLIVGFPGETENDFQSTLSAMRAVRYDATYSFMYNPRPRTRASRMPDDVPPEIKKRRLADLLELQKQIQIEIHQALVGHELEVLVEGKSRRGGDQYFGRDSGNRIVNFDYAPTSESHPWPVDPCGKLIRIKVTRSHPNSLFGEVASMEDMP